MECVVGNYRGMTIIILVVLSKGHITGGFIKGDMPFDVPLIYPPVVMPLYTFNKEIIVG